MEIEIQDDDLRQNRDTVLGLFAEHTGQDVATVEQDSRRDRWFTACGARDYGFVDRVIETVDDVTPARTQRMGLVR